MPDIRSSISQEFVGSNTTFLDVAAARAMYRDQKDARFEAAFGSQNTFARFAEQEESP